MRKILAIQSNPLSEINTETDTTLSLALEAQERNYQIIWYETKDINLITSKVFVEGKKVRFLDKYKKYYKVIIK